jgi:hypothetical protein
MTTTDKSRADALKTIAEFPVTDRANMDALNMRKIAADAIAAPVEQHEAAPADVICFADQVALRTAIDLAECMGTFDGKKAAHLREIVAAQPVPSAPLEGTGNGADERAPSVASHMWMPADIPDPVEVPQDFGDRKAYAFKDPEAGEHDPWYVVLPNMAVLKLGYHADDAVDRAHAEFIAAAVNRAVSNHSTPPMMPEHERAAFDMSDEEWLDVFERVQKTVPNVFGSYMKVRAEFAREVIRIANTIRASSPTIPPDERTALIAERDAAIMSTHRQALCIQQCAAHIGRETPATIDGLPLAVKRVVEELAARTARPEPLSADDREAMIRAREYVFDWQSEHGITLTVGAINHLARLMVGARAAASQPAAAAGQEAVGCLTVSRFRGLVNTDFDYYGSLSDGSYELYTAPPAQVATRQRLTDAQLRKSLSQAWNLGQTYWQQADSEYASQNRKSDGTRDKYLALVEETCAILGAKHE